MKKVAALLIAPFVLVSLLTCVILTLVSNVIELVCDAYMEYFSDVLELEK